MRWMIAIMQPRGVMVAQVILVHFVEVRILTGLPFFYLKILNCKQRVCWKTSFPHTLFSYSFATAWHSPRRKDFLVWLPCVTRPGGLALLRLAIASNPYGAAIFFALKKAKNTKSQDFSSLCRRHNFTQKTKFFLHIFTCSQKSCL